MKNRENIQILLLGIILLLQAVFLWIAYDKGGNISFGNFLAVFGLVLTVIGWFMIYYLGFRQSKKTISIGRKIDIYGKLVDIKESLFNNFFIDLVVYADYFDTDDLSDQIKIGKYILDLSKKIFKTQMSFQDFVNCAYAWMFLMPGLEKAKYILEKEFNGFLKELRSYHDLLQKRQIALIEAKIPEGITIQNKTSMPSEQEIMSKKEHIFNWSTDISNFIDDFLELVSDELIYPTFKYRQRRSIENLKEGQLYRKLTKDGIVEAPYVFTCVQREL